VGSSALGFPRSIPPQVPLQKCIDKRTTRRSARLQCSLADNLYSMVGGDGRISDQAGMPKNGMSCLPIASGSRLMAHGSPSKSETGSPQGRLEASGPREPPLTGFLWSVVLFP